jgi:hypothetical protein
VTLFTEEDAPKLKAIVNVMRASGCEVPDWMLQLKKGPKYRKRKEETGTQLIHLFIEEEYTNCFTRPMSQLKTGPVYRKRTE